MPTRKLSLVPFFGVFFGRRHVLKHWGFFPSLRQGGQAGWSGSSILHVQPAGLRVGLAVTAVGTGVCSEDLHLPSLGGGPLSTLAIPCLGTLGEAGTPLHFTLAG